MSSSVISSAPLRISASSTAVSSRRYGSAWSGSAASAIAGSFSVSMNGWRKWASM